MYKISDLILELNDISDKIWFIQSSDVTERSISCVNRAYYAMFQAVLFKSDSLFFFESFAALRELFISDNV